MNTNGNSLFSLLTNGYRLLRQVFAFLAPIDTAEAPVWRVPDALSTPWALQAGARSADFDNRPGLVIY